MGSFYLHQYVCQEYYKKDLQIIKWSLWSMCLIYTRKQRPNWCTTTTSNKQNYFNSMLKHPENKMWQFNCHLFVETSEWPWDCGARPAKTILFYSEIVTKIRPNEQNAHNTMYLLDEPIAQLESAHFRNQEVVGSSYLTDQKKW